MRTRLAPLLLFACSCSARSSLDVAITPDGSAPDAGLPSCAVTAEPSPPAPPPCSEYVAVGGDLAACGISGVPGPLPAEVCQVECLSDTCALLADAGAVGLGPTLIGCDCE